MSSLLRWIINKAVEGIEHRAMMTGTATHVPAIIARSRDGRRIPRQITAAPICDADGAGGGRVETFRDLSFRLRDLQRARRIQGRSLETNLPQDVVGGGYAFQFLDEDR